jgi:Ca2+-binding EF-hand superfamily protein
MRFQLFFLGLAGLPLVLHAQLRGTGEYLARMDVNRDARVSLSEYQDWLSYAFDAMDRNRDAVLTADELPGRKGRPITRAQHRERLAATFKKQDSNQDGFLSAKELAAPPR